MTAATAEPEAGLDFEKIVVTIKRAAAVADAVTFDMEPGPIRDIARRTVFEREFRRDPELEAIQTISDLLAPMSKAQVTRVMAYLANRYGVAL